MLVSIAQAQIFFLALSRILAILIQLPVLGGALVPNQVKVGLGFILAIMIIPWQPLPVDSPQMPLINFSAAILREIIIGTLVGFASTLTFGAFQTAGKVIDMSSGFGAGQLFNPTLGDLGSPLEQFFMMMVLIFFLIINGHHSYLLGLQQTFSALPIDQELPTLTYNNLLMIFTQLFSSGVRMALPIIGSLLLADLALGLVSRVAPQIQVFFLGLPIKILLGLVGLILSITILLPYMRQLLGSVGQRMIEILGIG